MSLPVLDYDLIQTFPLDDAALHQDCFQFGGVTYVANQASAWETSEEAWDNGDPPFGTGQVSAADRGYGRWHGPAAIHKSAKNLQVLGAALETLEHDVLARVSTLTTTTARWEASNDGLAFDTTTPGTWRVVLQDTGSGEAILNLGQPSASLEVLLPIITTPAILWVRIENELKKWTLPPDYLQVRGFTTVPLQYRYIENNVEYVWDWQADVGRRPASQLQVSLNGVVMWQEHYNLITSGGLLHRGEWTQYIVSGTPASGPWAALRIVSGDDEFTVGDDYQPYPGAVLRSITTPGTDGFEPVLVHPMALSVSAFEVIKQGPKAGEARLGGTIASTDGVLTAYWNFHPETTPQATLLGTSEKNYIPTCEASLYPTVCDILEVPNKGGEDEEDSDEYLLTYSTLHRYDPNATIADALLGLPEATLGHPGGRCLRVVDGSLKWFTEFFGRVGQPIGNDRFTQFYNTLRTLSQKQVAATGKGTVFHGNNAAEFIWGKVYGICQDKHFESLTAQQYLAYLEGETWTTSGMAPFSAATHHWQRVRKMFSGDGMRLVVSGKEAVGEGSIWGIAGGVGFQEASLPFRPRRLTRCLDAAGQEHLYCVGRFVSKNEAGEWECSLQQSAIQLIGEFKQVCLPWSVEDGWFSLSRNTLTQAGFNLDLLPPYLLWHADVTQSGGGYWTPTNTLPGEGRIYLELTLTEFTVRYSLPGEISLPYDPEVWCRVCFTLHDDGSVGNEAIIPEPCCTDADCVRNKMGGKYIIVKEEIASPPWSAIQVSDMCMFNPTSGLPEMMHQAQFWPNLWVRVDSTDDPTDLTTYTKRLRWKEYQGLAVDAASHVEICVLVPAGVTGVWVPTIDKR